MRRHGGGEARWPRYVAPSLLLVYVALAAVAAFTKAGDFAGYLSVGDAVLDSTDAYANPKLNTWPPFFSLLAVPLAAGARVWLEGTRLLWNLGTVALWWWSIRELANAVYGRRVPMATAAVLLPALFTTRLLIENLDAVQINVYILAACLLAVRWWRRSRDGWAGAALGLTVSVKVFPVFLSGFFLLRGQWRLALWTVATCLACAGVPFLAFGADTAVAYYATWAHQAFGTAVDPTHMNQSLLATLTRFLSAADAGDASRPLGAGYFVNAATLPAEAVKQLCYGAVAVLGAGVLYGFTGGSTGFGESPERAASQRGASRGEGLPSGELQRGRRLSEWLEIALVFGLCALVSPLVWKHYGVFWLPGLFVAYPFLYASPLSRGGPLLAGRADLRPLRFVYHLGWGLMTFASELFVGRYFSDVLEAYGVMAVGGLLLTVLLVYLRLRAANVYLAVAND